MLSQHNAANGMDMSLERYDARIHWIQLCFFVNEKPATIQALTQLAPGKILGHNDDQLQQQRQQRGIGSMRCGEHFSNASVFFRTKKIHVI
jgi:hypothetical protein